MERIRKLESQFDELSAAAEKMRKNAAKLREATERNYAEVLEVLGAYESGAVSPRDMVARMRALRRRYGSELSEALGEGDFHLSEIDQLELKNYLSVVFETWDSSLDECGDEFVKEIAGNQIPYIRRFGFNERTFRNETLPPAGMLADLILIDTHVKPYRYAEQYSAEELLATHRLYSMPDEEVRRIFFREREVG